MNNNYIEQKKNTHLYFQIGENKYKVSIELSDELPFVSAGDKLTIGYYDTNSSVKEVKKLY